MSNDVPPNLQGRPAAPDTATMGKLDDTLSPEVVEYGLELLAEIEQTTDLDRRANKLFFGQIWGLGPRTNALLQSTAEVGLCGPILKARIGQAKPAAEPRKQRPPQPVQHKQRPRVPVLPSLLDFAQELQTLVDQSGRTTDQSRPA